MAYRMQTSVPDLMDLSDEPVRFGSPATLITARPTGLSYPYAPTDDGERFLLIDSQLGTQTLNVVLDWTADIRGHAAR